MMIVEAMSLMNYPSIIIIAHLMFWRKSGLISMKLVIYYNAHYLSNYVIYVKQISWCTIQIDSWFINFHWFMIYEKFVFNALADYPNKLIHLLLIVSLYSSRDTFLHSFSVLFQIQRHKYYMRSNFILPCELFSSFCFIINW
jgi:hypothetical protein